VDHRVLAVLKGLYNLMRLAAGVGDATPLLLLVVDATDELIGAAGLFFGLDCRSHVGVGEDGDVVFVCGAEGFFARPEVAEDVVGLGTLKSMSSHFL
jgi:hypothetical protein